MEIDGGFDLLAPEASNYLLIAHAKMCVGKLGCDLNTSVDASMRVGGNILHILIFNFRYFVGVWDVLTFLHLSQKSIFFN